MIIHGVSSQIFPAGSTVLNIIILSPSFNGPGDISQVQFPLPSMSAWQPPPHKIADKNTISPGVPVPVRVGLVSDIRLAFSGLSMVAGSGMV